MKTCLLCKKEIHEGEYVIQIDIRVQGATRPLGEQIHLQHLINLMHPSHPYDEQGNLVAKEGQKFKQVGWRINGGENDGVLVLDPIDVHHIPHGSYSPIYIEVGD